MLESGGTTFTCPACKEEGKIEAGLPVGIYPADQTGRNSEARDPLRSTKNTGFRAEWIRMQGPGFSTYFHKNRAAFEVAPIELQEEARVKWLKLYPETPWPLVVDPHDALLEKLNKIDSTIVQTASKELGFDDVGRALDVFELKTLLEKCKQLDELSPEGQEINAVNKEINQYPPTTVNRAQVKLELPTSRAYSLDESNLLLAECKRSTEGARVRRGGHLAGMPE